VVVTGERTPLPLDRVPLDVTVVDEERLEAHRPILLAEVLRQVPAIDVQRSGSPGKLTDVRLRGADPRHTLVLFDGIPLNGPWLGTFDFSDLTDPGVRRVEVLGGPASALYGSGAVGGVIQLLTRVEGEAERRDGSERSRNTETARRSGGTRNGAGAPGRARSPSPSRIFSPKATASGTATRAGTPPGGPMSRRVGPVFSA
jgi:vitamin B12 transporter